MKLVYYTGLDGSIVGVLDGDKIFFNRRGTKHVVDSSEGNYAIIPIDRITEADINIALELTGDHVEFFIMKTLIQEVKEIKEAIISDRAKSDIDKDKVINGLKRALQEYAKLDNWKKDTNGLIPRYKWVGADIGISNPATIAQNALNKWGLR